LSFFFALHRLEQPVRTKKPSIPADRPRVALLIESSRAFGRGLLFGVAQYVREHGPWSIFLQERSLGDLSPRWLKNWEGDGIIARVENRPTAEAIRRLGLPAVDLRCLLPDLEFPSARPDDEGIAHLASEHLLERGFRHFAFCGFNGADYSDVRRERFSKRITEAGFQCSIFEDAQGPRHGSTLTYEEYGLKGEDRVARWLRELPRPVGLMACNDIRGQQVLNACRDVGLQVPDEVAVIGVDNDEMLCELSDPPLSSVAPNSKRIGYEAAALLARMMAGRKPPTEPIFVEPEGVITRRSTEVLAIDDRHIANVVRFIREHACEGIDVSDILKVVPLSRSALERRFARTLGRSPKEEILRVRLNRARQLLSETDFPLWTIAEKIGLEHTEYLNVIFKKKTGLTPGQFRAQGRGHPGRDKQPASITD
jgi:LacI family transcriptional regulator